MTKGYGQFCGLARAMELIGGRWTLLIVRDLMVGPKRFGELAEGLPGIPTNILSSRLRELEGAGVVTRNITARPGNTVAYELSPYGAELEDALLRLGAWGARSLGPPGEEDFFSVEALGLALKAAFDPAAGSGLETSYGIRLADDGTLFVHLHDGGVSFTRSAETEPEATLITTPPVFAELLGGLITFERAVVEDRLAIEGSKRAAARFFKIFHLATSVPGREQAVS